MKDRLVESLKRSEKSAATEMGVVFYGYLSGLLLEFFLYFSQTVRLNLS